MSNENPVAPESYKPAEGPEQMCGMSVDDKGTKCRKKPLHRGRCSVHPDPAATPVTVESKYSRADLEKYYRWRSESLKSFRDKFGAKSNCEALDAIDLLKAATPKPIGDVEAAAKTLYEKGFRYEGPVIFACEFGVTAESAQIETIAAILSPFFAPAPPCSECATPSKINLPWTVSGDSPSNPPMVWDASGDSIVNQMPDGTPYFEPEVAAFIGKAANSLAAHELECATLQGKLSAVVILLRARCSDKEWDAMPETLSEVLPAEIATLRKERDEYQEWMNCGGCPNPYKCSDPSEPGHEIFGCAYGQGDGTFLCEVHYIRALISRAEAAEAQLSTLRDALDQGKKAINAAGHKTSCGFSGCTCGEVDTFKSERLEFFRKLAALAPTPEVAPESVKLVSNREPTEAEIKQGLALQPMAEECLKRNRTPDVAPVKILRGQRKVSLELEHESETGTHSIGGVAPKE